MTERRQASGLLRIGSLVTVIEKGTVHPGIRIRSLLWLIVHLRVGVLVKPSPEPRVSSQCSAG